MRVFEHFERMGSNINHVDVANASHGRLRKRWGSATCGKHVLKNARHLKAKRIAPDLFLDASKLCPISFVLLVILGIVPVRVLLHQGSKRSVCLVNGTKMIFCQSWMLETPIIEAH